MTAASLSAALAEQVLAGRPPGALAEDIQGLDQVDAAAIAAAAAGGSFGFGGLSVVLVGDAAVVTPQLEKVGFPAPLLLDVEGRPAGSK